MQSIETDKGRDMLSQKDSDKVANAKIALMKGWLSKVVPQLQRRVLADMLRGEERVWFAERLLEIESRVAGMPRTYQQDGLGMDAVVNLHYFGGAVDVFVTELDKDWPEPGDYDQSFGWVSLYGSKKDGELGYTSIIEIGEVPIIELDLHWTPKPLKECLK